MSKQKRFILQENEIPTQWYNIQAEMPNKPLPPLNPATKEPLTAEDLAHIFSYECSKQELDTEHAWIDIPEPVLDMYKYYRANRIVYDITPVSASCRTMLKNAHIPQGSVVSAWGDVNYRCRIFELNRSK